jgi:predicted O-methyltransferase YrrM
MDFAARDFAGYDTLIAWIDEAGAGRLPGDFIEIGAFMGVGTAKLAAYAGRFGKRVIAVDSFEPESDSTCDSEGYRMGDIYVALLAGRSQRAVYEEATRGHENIETRAVDSMRLELSREQSFSFGFIDGNHDPAYVRHDFETVWGRLVEGGILALDDYGGTLTQARETIDELIAERRSEIERAETIPGTWIVAVQKASRKV